MRGYDIYAAFNLHARLSSPRATKDKKMAFTNTAPNILGLLERFSLYRFSDALTRFGVNMKIARMTSVLSAMSNDQLNQIGVKRSEISQYAEKLILCETSTK
jgi:hypothetical protein